MESLNNLLGGGLSDTTLLVILGAAAVIGLLILVWLFRMIFAGNNRRQNKNHRPRLSVTDAATVDEKRRLVLVRRDDVEHLIMIGGPTDIVIEPGIIRTAKPAAMQHTEQPFAETPSPAPQPLSSTPVATSAPAVAKPVEARPAGNLGAPITTGTAALAGGTVLAETKQANGSSLTGMGAESVEPVTDAVKQTVSGSSEKAADIMQEAVDIASKETQEVAAAASDVTSDLAGDLESALGIEKPAQGEAPAIDAAPKVESGGKPPSKTEDEMQRLLDELATTKN